MNKEYKKNRAIMSLMRRCFFFVKNYFLCFCHIMMLSCGNLRCFCLFRTVEVHKKFNHDEPRNYFIGVEDDRTRNYDRVDNP